MKLQLTWKRNMRVLAQVLIDGSDKGRQMAMSELEYIAQQIDDANAQLELLDAVTRLCDHYRMELHDGLSDMVETGRLDKSDIPVDYQWLVECLEKAAGLEAEYLAARARSVPE